jgi:hypothetical protein
VNQLKNIKLREIRYAIILCLYNWGETGANENTFKSICDSMKYGLSNAEIREQLFYLRDLGYCNIEDLPSGIKHATRTHKSIDLVEYSPDHNCPTSIERPPQEWFKP